jgi:hypothetical protein
MENIFDQREKLTNEDYINLHDYHKEYYNLADRFGTE